MKFFEFLISPILSLYSATFYRHRLNTSLKYGFSYLVYIAAIGAIIFLSMFKIKVAPVLDDFADWFSKEMPEIVIEGGHVSSTVPQPYTIKHPKYGTILMLDSSRDSLKPDEMGQTPIFITNTTVYIQNPIRKDTQVINLVQSYQDSQKNGKPLESERINGDTLRKMYAKAKPVFSVVITLAVFAYLFFWKLGAAFAYSLIAVSFNLLREKKFPYPTLLNVTIYAMTAVCILQLLGVLTQNIRFDIQPWVAIGVTTAYLGLVFFVAAPEDADDEMKDSLR